MATNISFRLRANQKGVTPSKQKETPIKMFVSFGYYEPDNGIKKYFPVIYSTGEKIKPCYWGKNRAKKTDKFDFENFNTRLDNLETLAKKAIILLKNENKELNPNTVRARIDLLTGRAITSEIPNLNDYLKQFIEEISSGARLTAKHRQFNYTTIKNFKALQSQLDLFQAKRGRKYNYNDIDIDFYGDFVKFFTDKNYSPNTIGKHISLIKRIMNDTREKGYHSNDQHKMKAFKKPSADTTDVYLTEGELKKMYDLKLKNFEEVARDVFLVGCYTALRFSDYSKIKPEHIRIIEGNKKVIDIKTQKTGEKVIVPIRPECDAILKKYNYKLPKTYEQKVNRTIKDIAEMAEITDRVLVEKIKGGMRVETSISKNKLIKTHTARRTGATNMYLAGISSIDIMKITGHKTEREFLKYIKTGKEETAVKVAQHPFFTGNNLKLVK